MGDIVAHVTTSQVTASTVTTACPSRAMISAGSAMPLSHCRRYRQKLASALEEEARRRGIHVEGSTDRSTHDPGDEADAPRVMLFVDRAELEDE